MQVYLHGDIKKIIEGTHILQNDYDITIEKNGFPIKVINRPGDIEVIHSSNETKIYFDKPIHFFRALGLWRQNTSTNQQFEIKEEIQFKTSGAMMDQSRNAVLTVHSVKKLLRSMALMGLNMLMLYTEDTYEVSERPYFGYMRGRYTEEELKELDEYAYTLGIELVPCIQTLAHLSQTLRWNYSIDFRDTSDILLVNEPKTYKFIEDMIKATVKPFRSSRVHIGMDEAFQLGRGNYIKKNGYIDSSQLMVEHLEKVVEITDKYDLKPMMWSDMFFRTASETGGYYDLNAEITDHIIQTIPSEVDLVYWDYYHSDEKFYKEFIKKHKELDSSPIFAGGAWTWNGIAPNYGKAYSTSEAALSACKKEGIDEVFVTVWGDNGAETPQSTALPVLQLFAEHTYRSHVTEEDIAKRFNFCTDGNYEDFLRLNELDEVTGVTKDNLEANSPSKFLLYQDVLMGLYDENIEGLDLNDYYTKLSNKLKKVKERSGKWSNLFEFYYYLAKVLSNKAEIGIHLKESYDNDDNEGIKNLLDEIVQIEKDLEKLRQSHRELWFSMYKPFGWEVIDIRYGGVLTRLNSAKYRLDQYIKGTVKELPELEEKRLHFEGPYPMSEEALGRNNYHKIVTAGDLG